MALWYTIENTSLASIEGQNITGETLKGIITCENPETGVHSGGFIQASNFKIGGATNGSGSTTLENTWSGGNVDTGVSTVLFEDEGTPGQQNNTVSFLVTFGSSVPSANKTYYIDIDENSTNPVVESITRTICFFLKIPFSLYNQWADLPGAFMHEFYTPDSNESIGWTVQTSIANGDITKTLVNATTYTEDGYYKYKFSGTFNEDPDVAVARFTRVLLTRSHLGIAIDPLPGAGDPDFSIHDHHFSNGTVTTSDVPQILSLPEYVGEMSYFGDITGWDTSNVFALVLDVGAQMNSGGQYAIEELCAIGDTIDLQVETYDPLVIVDEDGDVEGGGTGQHISDVITPQGIGSTAGWKDIVVEGSEGSEYGIYLYKTAGLTSTVPASGYSWYDFRGEGGMSNARPSTVFKIAPGGRTVHRVLLPKSLSRVKYELYVEPVGGTTLRAGVPTKPGDRGITQEGVFTVTISPYVFSSGKWDVTNASTSFKRKPKTPINEFESARKHHTATTSVKVASTNSNRLIIEDLSVASNLTEGAYVMSPMLGNSNVLGSGIPHLTTVESIKENVITLSAAISGTIPVGAPIRFETKSSRIVPFSLPFGAGLVSGDYRDLSILTGTNYKPTLTIGGLTRRPIKCVVSSPCSAATAVSCTGNIMHAKAGMVMRSAGKIFPNGKGYVEIASVRCDTNNSVTLVSPVTLALNDVITFTEHPDAYKTGVFNTVNGVTLLHAQANMTTSSAAPDDNKEVATLSGYLDVKNVSNDVTVTVYPEALIGNT